MQDDNRRSLLIKYIDRYVQEDDINLPIYNTIRVTTSHTKRYHNCLYLLANLQGCARNLMDYLTERMDNDNNVASNSYVVNEFIAYMKKGNVVYGVDSVNKAFKKLKDKNFLIVINRGFFKVNPKYFIKNNDTGRADMIKMMLEFKVGDITTDIMTNIEEVENIEAEINTNTNIEIRTNDNDAQP